MGLQTQQGIVIYSQDILQGEKLQALITEITLEYITIYVPIDSLVIFEGAELYVNFWDANATYEFKTKALTSKKINDSTLNISRPETLIRVVNRSYPRIVIKREATLFDYSDHNKEQCILVDISATGAMITTRTKRKKGDLIKISFWLTENEFFELVAAKIIWQKKINNQLSDYGIEFQNLSEIRKQKLIRMIDEKIAEQVS